MNRAAPSPPLFPPNKMPSLRAVIAMAAAAIPAMWLQWGHVMVGFVVGMGAAWLLLKGSGPNTRRDALRRFKVRACSVESGDCRCHSHGRMRCFACHPS